MKKLIFIGLLFTTSLLYGQTEKVYSVKNKVQVATLDKYKCGSSGTVINTRYDKLGRLILEVQAIRKDMLIFYYEYDKTGNRSRNVSMTLSRVEKKKGIKKFFSRVKWDADGYFSDQNEFDEFIDKMIKILSS